MYNIIFKKIHYPNTKFQIIYYKNDELYNSNNNDFSVLIKFKILEVLKYYDLILKNQTGSGIIHGQNLYEKNKLNNYRSK